MNVNNVKFENLTTTERFVRFAISIATILVLMESTLVGSTLFAVACLVAVALATTAIIGWDPIKSVSLSPKLHSNSYRVNHTQKHA